MDDKEKIKEAKIISEKKEKNNNTSSTKSFFDVNNKSFLILISVFITIIVCFIIGVVLFKFSNIKITKVTKDVTITDTGIAEAVDKVYDAVVVVEVYQNGQLSSTGTGFVFKKDNKNGYILTNNHVISNGNEVYVVFTDNTKEKVNVVGADDYSDIAVLSVDKSKVKSVASIGSSKDLKVGDTTFAVGAPLSAEKYSWTVTRGILSGKNRTVEVTTTKSGSNVIEVLQTDAAINSGNSGGPLCNANGEVIGITNLKIASSSVEGMGFAIPIETAITYANKFINNESISRPYLGVSMYDLSSNMFSNETGIYVESVEANSPAQKAGLQKGDIIIKIGDVSVENSSYLKYELYKYNVGDKVKITYKRNKEEKSTTVTLGSYNSNM